MSLKIPGKEIALGGETFVMPALNAATTKQYREEIRAVFVDQVPDLGLVSKLAYLALKRNYPDITTEQVDELVDYGNLFDVWEAMLNLSGLAVASGKLMQRVQEEMTKAGLKTP